jgi:4-diphosphocytidyl-2-C-methyl-D-erythritol kinase
LQTSSVEAPAKLTVHLRVTGVRDDGMHLIDAEMVSLNFHDTLQFSDGEGLEIVGARLSNGPENLVNKALHLVGRTARVTVTKRIPIGGGLGGGSADAAAVLRWASFDDYEAAARIGADIPFCINGGRARVQGIGEVVEPLPFVERTYTLLLPPFGVNTGAVFKKYDEMAEAGAIASGVNHLEGPALAVEPRLALWRHKFASWTGKAPILAGSGSTWFVEGSHASPGAAELAGSRWIVAETVPAR